LAILARPVKARAARIAIIVPSLPLFVNRICSTEATRSTSISARTVSRPEFVW